MPVTRHPPHRCRRAALPHRAPASGRDAQALRGIGRQDMGWRQPWGGEGVYPPPRDTMARAAPSECATPIAEYPFPKHPQHAHVARHPIIRIGPCSHTLEPCPELPHGPVHPLSQGLFDLLQRLAEPPARPRLTAYGRQAETVEGRRFPLTTPLAPFACPTPKLHEARLVRVQCAVKPVEAFP
jgi:hypothetical protein